MEIGSFCQETKKLSKESLLLITFKDDRLVCLDQKNQEIEIKIINYQTDFNSRNKSLLDESILQKKTVTLIGLGSGGSQTAIGLARSGVTNFNLIDFDCVTVSNICRSVYDLTDIGKEKTKAIFEKLILINPEIKVYLFNQDLLSMDQDELLELIDSSDLIIEATDSVKTKLLINGFAHNKIPVIYPSVYSGGKAGEVLFTTPESPCFECVFNSIIPEMEKQKKNAWDYTTGQAKPMPALIADIMVVVARSIKLALGFLTQNQEDSFLHKVTEENNSILFIGNEKDTFIFDHPFQEIWGETEIDPECTCQTLR